MRVRRFVQRPAGWTITALDVHRKARQLASLGGAPAASLKLYLAYCLLWGCRRAGLTPPLAITLALNHRGHTVRFVATHYGDLRTAREIFLDGAYVVPVDLDPKVIFDVGSNTGLSLGFFRVEYPEATIFGFEADPRTYARLTASVRDLPGVTVLNVAVGERDEPRTFYSSADSSSSSIFGDGAAGAPITVPGRSLGSLMAELGVGRLDLVKLDIEGSEWELLGGSPELDEAGAIIGELHLRHAPDDYERRLASMSAFDFTVWGEAPGLRSFLALRR